MADEDVRRGFGPGHGHVLGTAGPANTTPTSAAHHTSDGNTSNSSNGHSRGTRIMAMPQHHTGGSAGRPLRATFSPSPFASPAATTSNASHNNNSNNNSSTPTTTTTATASGQRVASHMRMRTARATPHGASPAASSSSGYGQTPSTTVVSDHQHTGPSPLHARTQASVVSEHSRAGNGISSNSTPRPSRWQAGPMTSSAMQSSSAFATSARQAGRTTTFTPAQAWHHHAHHHEQQHAQPSCCGAPACTHSHNHTSESSNCTYDSGINQHHHHNTHHHHQQHQQHQSRPSPTQFTGFDALVPMRISTKSSDRLQYVQLSLQFTTTALDREVLSIRLTDPADPLFLYCSNIDQNDFLSLKRHQDIKVDFRSFPLEVQHLVQLCVAEADAPMPRYVCELRCADDHGGAAAVHLIETNTFKNLNHLTLSVVPGDDGAIKAYLADCLKQLQAENSHLSSNCEDMAATIDSLRESLAVSEETRVRAEDEHARALHDATQRLQREKEEAVASTRQQLERARRETETSLTQEHERRVHASRQDAERLQARVEELTRSNEEMVKLRYSLEARVNELEVQLSRCQEQLDERTQRAEQHRARADDLAANKRAVEEELTRAHARIDELRQQCDAHTRAAADTEQTVADLQAQLEDKSKELEDTKEHADTLTRTLQSCHAEIHRGNAIITQYQKDLADATSGLDARDRVTVEQERRVKELEAETKRLQEDVAGLQREYEAAMQRNKEQTAELHALTGTVDTQQQELKAKERMIAWLSKRQQELEEKEREVALNSVAAKKRVPLGGIDVNGAFVFQAPGAKRQQFADKPADPAAAKSRAPAQFRPTNRQKQQQQQQQRGVPQPHPMPTKPTTDYSLLLSAP